MRNVRIVGEALVVALVLVVAIGAGTASATRLCAVNATPCTSIYALDTTFTTQLVAGSQVVITTSGGAIQPTFTCNQMTTGVTSTTTGGAAGVAVAVKLNALAMTMTNCSSINPASCSPVLSIGSLAGARGVINYTSLMNGTLQLTMPVIGITCPILGVSTQCTFGGSGTVDGTVTGGNPATVGIVNQSLVAISGFGCPTASTLNAQLRTTPIFVSTS
jgi:hypothetical protein